MERAGHINRHGLIKNNKKLRAKLWKVHTFTHVFDDTETFTVPEKKTSLCLLHQPAHHRSLPILSQENMRYPHHTITETTAFYVKQRCRSTIHTGTYTQMRLRRQMPSNNFRDPFRAVQAKCTREPTRTSSVRIICIIKATGTRP